MFQEITLQAPFTQDEIMAHVDMRDFDLLCAYCYADAIPVIEVGDKERKVRTYKMTNNLFRRIHLGDFKKYSEQENLVICLDDEDDEHFDEEIDDAVRKCLSEHLPTVEIL